MSHRSNFHKSPDIIDLSLPLSQIFVLADIGDGGEADESHCSSAVSTRLDTQKETRSGTSVELIANPSYFYILTKNVCRQQLPHRQNGLDSALSGLAYTVPAQHCCTGSDKTSKP